MIKSAKQTRISNIVLMIIALFFAIPTIWLVLATFDASPTVGLRIPDWTLDNLKVIIGSKQNLQSFGNSLTIAVSSALLSTIIGSVAAYPLSRFKGKYKNAFMLVILLMSTMPMTVAVIPIFKFYVKIGLNNSLLGLVLLNGSTSLPYSIWLMRNFFNAVSVELEEAAWVDGTDRLGSLRHIVLPLSMPGLASVFIYNFTGAWSGFYSAFILLSDKNKFPASVMLYQFMGEFDTAYGRLAAFAICYTIPAVVLYFFSQKYMSQGFSMQGGVKG